MLVFVLFFIYTYAVLLEVWEPLVLVLVIQKGLVYIPGLMSNHFILIICACIMLSIYILYRFGCFFYLLMLNIPNHRTF